MSAITKATFNRRLAAAVKADHTLAGNIQELIEFGVDHYAEHGDAPYLEALMNANFRTTRKEAIRAYIVAHTNLKCTKHPSEEGVLIFKVDPKSPNGKRRFVGFPMENGEVVTWDQFSKEKLTIDFDIDARIKSLIGQAKKALAGEDGKKCKVGTIKHTRQVLANLEQLVPAEGSA